MPLTKKDMVEIKNRRRAIHWILLDFFDEHPGQYFTKEEIAEETEIPKDEDELGSELISMVIRIDYGDVEMFQKEGKTYFGREKNDLV